MPDITIKEINVLRGPNIWAHQPVIEAHIDIGPYEDRPSNEIEGFTERLFGALPTLISHRCSEGRWGGFLMRMREGTYMGHIMEHVALELQCLAGMEVAYGKTRSIADDLAGEYHLIIEYEEERAGKYSIEVAAEGCECLACGEPYDFTSAINELAEIGGHRMLSPELRALRDAARKRGIPWLQPPSKWRDYLQLGYGSRSFKVMRKVWGEGIAIVPPDHEALTIDVPSPDLLPPMLHNLFPDGADGRIPIIAITGSRGKSTVVRMLATILDDANTADGEFLHNIGTTAAWPDELTSTDQAERVLTSPSTGVAVLETNYRSILNSGLAYDVCDVGVVLNVAYDSSAPDRIRDIEDLALTMGVVIESVRRNGYGVLNADDPQAADLARLCDGEIIFFSRGHKNPVLKAHLKKGGRGVTIIDGKITLQHGKEQTHVLSTKSIYTKGGSIPFQIDNALAATSAAWALRVIPDSISAGLIRAGRPRVRVRVRE